jgi:hypothetical protein
MAWLITIRVHLSNFGPQIYVATRLLPEVGFFVDFSNVYVATILLYLILQAQ